MRNRATWYLAVALMIAAVFSYSGCTRLFGGPSDQDAIKAINENEFFKHGIVLQSPIVILKKDSRNKKGLWPVKIKAKISYVDVKKGQVTVDQSMVFYLYKAKDSSGKDTWKATLKP